MTIAKDTSPTYNCPAQANGEGAVENGSGVGKEGTSVSSTTDTTFPPRPLPLEPSPEELLQCQFSSWFPKFRYLPKDLFGKRTNVTIKSEIITALPDEFIDFLHSDGIRLPEGATQLSSCAPNEQPQAEEDDDEDDDDNDNDISRQFSFPRLNQDIAEAIEPLGGDVIPKLNWSTPKDATWVNEGTLKCRTPGDVYLLLKSSDFCMHDLQQYDSLKEISSEKFTMDASSQRDPPRLELVLRKWCNFYPSMEFRCFVRNHTLIGISQRNHTQHYPHLLRDKYMIRSFLLEFFDDVIVHRFADNKVKNYVFDVYLDKSERVWLLDFNVWSIQTDALLFEWEELVDMDLPVDTNLPELRVVETALEVRQDPLSSYRAPTDTVELASVANRDDATSFESFMAMCQKPSELVGGRDEDEDSST